MTRIIPLRPLWALALLTAATSPVRAADELGPNELGLPGLASTVVAPERGGAPLRLGLHFGTATLDDEHGIAVDLGTPDVSTRSLRALAMVRASRTVVFGVALPYRWVSVEGGESLSGLGDVETSASARVFSNEAWRLGLWGTLRLPTGEEEKGLGTGRVEGSYGVHSTLRFFRDGFAPEMRWHLNLGYRVNKAESEGYGARSGDLREVGAFPPVYPGLETGEASTENDEVLLRTALEFRRRWGHIFLEASWDWLATFDRAKTQESAAWLTPGIYVGQDDGPGLKVTWSILLSADDAATAYVPQLPDWHLQLGVSMPIYLGGRDRDDDGINDDRDTCPLEPEDPDGFEDQDGCPDEDNDRDGIEDRLDLAPNLPEDFDGFEDEDGRPDRDNDLDGIVDEADQCPNRPEDFDGFEDEDGCPDVVIDADEDGIEDDRDTCPLEPEDLDGFEDEDGCPDPDNDLDGMLDGQDLCPLDAEDYDGFEDDDGCPDPPAGSESPQGQESAEASGSGS